MVVNDETHFQYVLSALGVKLPLLISRVKDILPHLGDGFIEVEGKLCVDPLGGGGRGMVL